MMGPPMGYSNRMPGGRYNDDSEPDPEQNNKLFIGGLSFETNENSLKTYFSKWGEIKDVIVMKDASTKRSRGFGFIKFKSRESVDDVQKARPHKIDDRDVETKRAMPRDFDPVAGQTVKKMFVGGLKEDTKEDQVRECFTDFGEIDSIEMIQDKQSGRTKGFCFVTFTDYDPVDKLVLKRKIELNGKKVELKKAFAKGELAAAQGRMGMPMGMPMGRGGRGDFGYGQGYPGGYGGYGGPGYGPNYNGNGMYGGYNDFGYNGHPQGNQRGDHFKRYGGNNNYGNNYGNGFNRR